MKEEFDFKRIGKRMPYTTPQNCFEDMEEYVLKEIRQKPAGGKSLDKRLWHRTIMGTTAIAASIALVFILKTSQPGKYDVSMEQVEQTFATLSCEDQAYMLDVYQNDIFINE